MKISLTEIQLEEVFICPLCDLHPDFHSLESKTKQNGNSIQKMDFLLMDIKNFLMKLENGQLEIEAGQWELHRDLENMNKAVCDLMNLKEDVEEMKKTNLQQMGLIKEFQTKLNEIYKDRSVEYEPLTVSESSLEYERVFKRQKEPKDNQQGSKKRKCGIRSEVIEITSEDFNDKSVSDSNANATPPRRDENKSPKEGNSEVQTYEAFSSKSYELAPEKKSTGSTQYPVSSASNAILQRYLKDSAKYRQDNKRSKSSSREPDGEKTSTPSGHLPFWDEISSMASPESEITTEGMKTTEGPSVIARSCKRKPPGQSYCCKKCIKKFSQKSSQHRRKLRKAQPPFECQGWTKAFNSRERLKKLKAIHEISERAFNGFKCCYCHKTCGSPGNLTKHLRKCRIITKNRIKNQP